MRFLCRLSLFQLLPSFIVLVLISCSNLTDHHSVIERKCPRFSVNELVYDFGIAGPGEKIKHTFRFKNTGNSPLKIIRYETSCGCLASLLSKKVIKPGETGSIRVVFKTRPFEGKQEKEIVVYSNDPQRPKVQFIIRGIIKKIVALEPSGINFGNVKRGQLITRHVRLLELSKKRLKIKDIIYDPRLFTVRTTRFKEENARGIDIELTLNSNIASGQLNEVITVITNLKRRPRIDIPIWANIKGNILIKPEMLSVGLVKKGKESKKELRIYSEKSHFFIKKVECNLPFVSTSVHTKRSQKDYEIILKFSPFSPAGNFSGMIKIFTTDKDQNVIIVPIYGIIIN